MAQNGLTEDSTGDLICCGYSVFTPGAGQTYRTNVPVPGYRRFQRNIPNMHRWNGATYIEVPQPAITTCHTSTPADTLRAELDSDEDSDQAAGNAHEWELWDGNPDDGGVVAFKISLVNNIVTLSTPMSGGITFGDVQVNSLGVGVVPSGGTGQIDTASVIRAVGGSAGVPSFSFTNDIDTGVYRVTADQIGFATSGVLRVRIDNGNVRLYVGQVWNTDNTNDMGASGALRPRTMYLGTALNVGDPVVSTVVGDARFGDGTREFRYVAATASLLNISGVATTGGLVLAAFNATDVVAQFNANPSTGEVQVGAVGSGSGNYFPAFYSGNAQRWRILTTGHLVAASDNAYDHGNSGALRPRTGYFGTSLNVGDGVTVTVVNGSAAFGDGTRSWKFDAAAGTVTQTINLNGAQNSLVLENTNAGAGAQVRASFQIGADVGSGNAKGMVLFHTTANAGWANYEARSLIFYTGPTAGAATPRVEISKTGRTRVYQDLRVGSAVDTIDEGDFCAGNIYHRVWFDRSLGQWVHIWDRNGAAADVIIRNNNAGAGAQARFALQRGGDAGTGTARGMVLFHTSAGAGWANYEALPLQFYTGTSAGSASVRASIAKTGGVRIGSGAPVGNSGDLRIDGVLTHAGATSGFNNATPVAKQTITGSRGGNAALASLLTALATVGLITDSTT